jgi:hypothetical protein
MESDIPMDASLVDIDKDSETEYASGDTLGKLWAFINQVRVCCIPDKQHRNHDVLGGEIGGSTESVFTQDADTTHGGEHGGTQG